MPDEDPNHAEELLKRYARERRERTGGFSLHPATRRLLQTEVARQYPAADTKRRWRFREWLAGWRPGLALGATAAVAGLLLWIGRDSEDQRSATLGDEIVSSSPVTSLPDDSMESKQVAASAERSVSFVEDAKRLSKKEQLGVDPDTPPRQLFFDPVKQNDFVAPVNPPPQPGAGQPAPAPLQQLAAKDAEGDAAAAKLKAGTRVTADSDLGAKPALPANQPRTSDSLMREEIVANGAVDARKKAKDSAFGSAPATTLPSPGGVALELNTSSGRDQIASTPTPGLAPAPLSRAPAPRPTAMPLAPAAPAEAPVDTATAVAGAVFYRQAPADAYAVLLKSVGQVDELRESETPQLSAGESVLSEFTFQKQGNTVRMLEADGSVYQGAIDDVAAVAGDAPATRPDLADQTRSRALRSNAVRFGAPARFYSFRAVGTNITLGKPVVVTGRVVEDGLSTARSRTELGSGGTGGRLGANEPQARAESRRAIVTGPATMGFNVSTNVPVTNRVSSIEGTVRIGGTNERPFRAVTTGR